jgi:nucleoside-diphosphate-sugar epimerase
MNSRPILITGIRGFVGTSLAARIEADGSVVRGVSRQYNGTDDFVVGNIGLTTDWGRALEGIDTIVHLAGCAHIMKNSETDLSNIYWSVNVDGTEELARQAAKAGIRRFIFVSTIKVNGEFTKDLPFSASSTPEPEDDYGVSKLKAEEALWRIAENSGLEVVIVRPPLVYGPGVKANFLSMMHWLAKGIPLPFGAIDNKRSFAALDNLVDLLVTCIHHPAAAGQTFLVSDDEDISTTELLQRMGKALNRSARLIPVPPKLLQWGAQLLGKEDIAQRLLGNLQVDISKTKELLDWKPPVTVDEGLKRTAEWYWEQR